MLQYLHVKNLALIDEIEVEFGRGLNILTGDDTIMCAIRTVEDTAVVMENIRKLVSRKA